MLSLRFNLFPRTTWNSVVVGTVEAVIILFALWAPFKEGRPISYTIAAILLIHLVAITVRAFISERYRWYRSVWGKLGLGFGAILLAFLALDHGLDLWDTLYGFGVSTDVLAIPYYSWWHDVVLTALVLFGIWQAFQAARQISRESRYMLPAVLVLALALSAGLYWGITETSVTQWRGITLPTGWQENEPSIIDVGFCGWPKDKGAWGMPFATNRVPVDPCFDPATNQAGVYLNDLSCVVVAGAASLVVVNRLAKREIAKSSV